MRLTVRSAAIGTIVVLGVSLTAVLSWFNYIRSTETALNTAAAIVDQAGKGVLVRTRLLAQPFQLHSTQVPLLPQSRLVPKGFDHPLLPAFLDMLADSPQIYSLYFGYGDGGFFQVISLIGRPEVAAKLKAPAHARFTLRRIEARGADRQERWRHLDEQHAPVAETGPEPATYDPRTRPWFKSSEVTEGPLRTDLYIFSSTQKLGLTVSSRVPDAPGTVIFGMDLTLNSLSEYLAEARVGASGRLILFDSGGKLIGHPDPAKLYREAQGTDGAAKPERATMTTLGDPAALACFQAFEQGGGQAFASRRLRAEGVDYLVQVQNVAELGGNGDFLAVIARVDDFTGPMIRTRNESLLFALAMLLAGAPVLAYLAGRISGKLRDLAHEADRIRSLDLDSDMLMRSHIDEMERLGSAIYGMRSALKSFSRYLPRALVKQFVDTGIDPVLGGVRRELTLLFTDVADFTPLSERLAPEELMQAMSEYFQAVGSAILESGGTIDKFIGDAVMAFWNAPIEAEDHVQHACLAALRLKRASDELNARREADGLPPLRTRVGVHTGPAVVGNVGSADRMDYTALGSSVNLASRLEGMNKFYATSILVSRSVRERARAQFLFRSVDVVIPKGASEPLALFELVGALPNSPFAEVAAPRASLGFCSRWERAITLYRTMQWDRALVEFTALSAAAPDDHLAGMYCTRTKRLLENKQGKDWKAVQRFQEK